MWLARSYMRSVTGCASGSRADIDGFSLHAAVRCGADDRKALEPLCRYSPARRRTEERVQTNAAGQVVLKLKQAQDTLARRHHASGDVAAGVHATAGGTGDRRAPFGRPCRAPLQGASCQWPDPSPGTNSPLDCLSPGSAAAPDPLWCPLTSLREVSGPPLRDPWRAGPQRQASRVGGAARTRAAYAGRTTGRMRGELCAPPAGAAELGAAAHACVRAGPGALPELRRRADDHRGDPGTAGDREDSHAPGVAGAGAAEGASARAGAASGLTIQALQAA